MEDFAIFVTNYLIDNVDLAALTVFLFIVILLLGIFCKVLLNLYREARAEVNALTERFITMAGDINKSLIELRNSWKEDVNKIIHREL